MAMFPLALLLPLQTKHQTTLIELLTKVNTSSGLSFFYWRGVAIGIIENGKAMPLAVIFNLWHLFLYFVFLRSSLTKTVTLGSQQLQFLQCFNGKVVTWKLNSSAVQITCWSVHLYILLSAPCLLSSPNSKVSEHEPRTTLLLFLSLGLAPTPGLLAPPCQSGPDPVQAPHENPLPVKVLTSNKTYVGKVDVIFAGTSITTRANPAHPWL